MGGAGGTFGAGGTGGGGSGLCGGNGVCLPLPPPGWSGPVALIEGASPLPDCNSDYPVAIYGGHASLDCGVHSCSPCGCSGTPIGGNCQVASADVYAYQDAGCTGDWVHFDAQYPGCYNLSGSAYGASVKVTASPPQATGTTCAAASGGVPTLGTAAWGSDVRLCEAAVVLDSCAQYEMCAELPSSPLSAPVCIVKHDVQSCAGVPAPYSERMVFYTGYADTRGCASSCSCAAAGKVCHESVYLHSWAGCDGELWVVAADNDCHEFAGAVDAESYNVSVTGPDPGTGTCSPNGTSTPTGSCEPNDGPGEGVMTACCTP
jgi:hypothetical protein